MFSEGDILYRKEQGKLLRESFGDDIEIYNPIEAPFNEDKDLAVPEPQDIFIGDFKELQSTDILVFDFSELEDPGVSMEVGIMAQRIAVFKSIENLPVVIGILSDSRAGTSHSYAHVELPPLGCNHMVLGFLKMYNNKIVPSFKEAINEISKLMY